MQYTRAPHNGCLARLRVLVRFFLEVTVTLTFNPKMGVACRTHQGASTLSFKVACGSTLILEPMLMFKHDAGDGPHNKLAMTIPRVFSENA